MRQWRKKLKEAYARTLTFVESRSHCTVALVVVLSCVAAWLCSPYSLSIAQGLLILTVTAFSIFFVAYVFLCNRLKTQVDFIEEEINDIAQYWVDKRYKRAKKAIEVYKREYKTAFFFMLSAECLLLASILLLIYTVFVGACRWVETVGLGFIIAALILLILWLLLHHMHLDPGGLFRDLELYLKFVHNKHKPTGPRASKKKGLSE